MVKSFHLQEDLDEDGQVINFKDRGEELDKKFANFNVDNKAEVQAK